MNTHEHHEETLGLVRTLIWTLPPTIATIVAMGSGIRAWREKRQTKAKPSTNTNTVSANDSR